MYLEQTVRRNIKVFRHEQTDDGPKVVEVDSDITVEVGFIPPLKLDDIEDAALANYLRLKEFDAKHPEPSADDLVTKQRMVREQSRINREYVRYGIRGHSGLKLDGIDIKFDPSWLGKEQVGGVEIPALTDEAIQTYAHFEGLIESMSALVAQRQHLPIELGSK